MKILRIGAPGRERFAVAVDDGHALELDVPADPSLAVARGTIEAARRALAAPHEARAIDLDGVRVGPPLVPGKIVCVGLNYRRHAAEAGMPVPAEPILFLKASDTVGGPDDDVVIPSGSTKTDYEVELGVVIGRVARTLRDPAAAMEHVAGYLLADDVSERAFQLERGGQWDKGKNCETFSPLGPFLVTADEVPDPQALRLTSAVNGEVRQDSSTADMIFPVDHLVWYTSQFMTLHPGDVILTGTPEGVGSGFEPPRFLAPGDVVEISIAGLGRQRHRLIAAGSAEADARLTTAGAGR
ncbi:fumarylacetoacetate hydrolase family protein [Galbitalea sp. SE-J8]|uniref:fumarylacetoacetate hydrolase family protein n=1 Tax=Galbitalea sp. SE-J8 TaxID=3054952 RepID=UPI00259D017C|nr:fumarylacetoacetate hydrolase family protein [Galbitalea sp. SE-J8]MDM4761996.1 fumarylacetoacetate hydrolase family protein [Galbitalea sp. SE-J8]